MEEDGGISETTEQIEKLEIDQRRAWGLISALIKANVPDDITNP